MSETAMIDLMTGTTEKERGEINAVAWLILTDDELIERSGSLGLPGDLHPVPHEIGAAPYTEDDVVAARKQADTFAVEHAGKKFVSEWIKENR